MGLPVRARQGDWGLLLRACGCLEEVRYRLFNFFAPISAGNQISVSGSAVEDGPFENICGQIGLVREFFPLPGFSEIGSNAESRAQYKFLAASSPLASGGGAGTGTIP